MGKRAIGSTAILLALVGGCATLGEIPMASAGTKPMHISASGGDGTKVDKDGTQGKFTDSVQGIEDNDGDQDATDMIKSDEAMPQTKSPNKMTKR